MNDIMNNVGSTLGQVSSSPWGHAFIGLAILVVGLFAVKMIAGLSKKLLVKVPALSASNSSTGKPRDLVTPVVSLLQAVLTIFVLMAVLEHFGLTNVLQPLQVMASKFTAVIPNIIGAGVIAYAGWIIATVVSQLVGAVLDKVDEQLVERTGNQDVGLSRFGSALVFALILLPIAVSALGVLDIPAISEPASSMIAKLMAAVPNIVGAAIVLLVIYFAAKFAVHIVDGLLLGMNIDALPAKIGIEGLFTDTFTPRKLVAFAIMFFSMLAAATAAVNILEISVISEVFAHILAFGGGLLVGGLILIIGNFLGRLAHDKLSEHGDAGLANIARIAILGLVLAMGLKAMGLADEIVTMAFGFTLGSVAVAGALAFGLGGRDAAKSIADKWAKKINTQ